MSYFRTMSHFRYVSFLRNIVLLTALPIFSFSLLRAEDAEEKKIIKTDTAVVSFIRDVQPILRRNCHGCHQPAKAGGKLVLTEYAALVRGGRSQKKGPLLVPGDPDKSLLFMELISIEGEAPAMPKKAKPLHKADVQKIRVWIEAGARDDTPARALTAAISMENPPVYENPPVISSLDYSPDGKLLAVTGYHETLIYKADGSELVARFIGLSERVESVRFSPSGDRLAVTGGAPGRVGEVQIWDVAKHRLLVSKQLTFDTLYGGSWSPDGKLVAFGCCDGTLRAVDAKSGKQVLFQGAHSDWVLDTAFSKDSSYLVSVSRDRTLKLTRVDTEQFIDNITSITPGALKGGLMVVDRHPKEDQLLVGGSDGAPMIYRMHRKKARKIGDDFNLIRKFDALPGRLFGVRFSADGSKIAACSSDSGAGEVRLYQVADGKLLWKHPVREPLYAISIRNDGKTIAVGGALGLVRIFEAEKGQEIKSFVPVPLSF